MVSYYNASAMYRHQQPVAPAASWYGGYHHQGAHQAAPGGYLPQEEAHLWHHPAPGVFHGEFPDFVHSAIPALQPQGEDSQQLPSPAVSSELSSPGGHSGTVSPGQQARPPPARSPYEWIKKTSYQTQPNPGKTRTKDKYRVVYTDHQRIELEKEFTFNNKYITIRRKSELAASLGLSERQVKIWFQNRRAKERKQNKKRVEEKQQIEMYNNIPMSGGPIINQHTQQLHHHQQLEQQPLLPGVVTPPTLPMHPYDLDAAQALKIEQNDSDQLGAILVK